MSYLKGKIIGIILFVLLLWLVSLFPNIRKDVNPTPTATVAITSTLSVCLPVWSVECQATASALP